MIPAAKAAYITAVLRAGSDKLERFSDPMEIADWTIEQAFATKLNKLKKSNPEAFFYWYHSAELIKTLH